MKDSEQENSQPRKSDFVETHCRICAAGQTITRHEGAAHAGGKGTYCLLLREWMTDAEGKGLISDCDRYEERAQDAAD